MSGERVSCLDYSYCHTCRQRVVNIDAAVCTRFGCDARNVLTRIIAKAEGTRPPKFNPGEIIYVDPYRGDAIV